MLVIIFVGHHLTQITWQKISLGGSCFSGVRVTVKQSIETYRRCASLVRTKGFKDLRPTMVINVTRNKLKLDGLLRGCPSSRKCLLGLTPLDVTRPTVPRCWSEA